MKMDTFRVAMPPHGLIFGGIEAYNGKSHFRTQFLAYLGLWSQGLMFIGPLFILMGMGLSYLSRKQFGLVEG